MKDWWNDNGPPVYMSAAGYLGLIKDKKGKKQEVGNLEDLARMFGSTGGVITGG